MYRYSVFGGSDSNQENDPVGIKKKKESTSLLVQYVNVDPTHHLFDVFQPQVPRAFFAFLPFVILDIYC